MKSDLHTHSTASDGTLTPTSVVDKAIEKGIEVLAITDHDNVSGVAEAIEYAKGKKIKVLSGVELSAFSNAEIHILGYNINYKSDIFLSEIDALLKQRKLRSEKILEKLASFKIFIEMSRGSDECVGRLHIAKAMVEKGYVGSVNEAFERYLATNKSAFVPSQRLSPLKAVSMIKEAGGTAVLAHPMVFLNKGILPQLVEGLMPYGLKGIEAYYPSHKPNETERLSAFAEKMGLITTGGSDFHGENSHTELGSINYEPSHKTRIELKF